MVIDGTYAIHCDIADRIRTLLQEATADRIHCCHGFASYFYDNKDKTRTLSGAAIVDGNTVDSTLSPHQIFASFKKAISPRKMFLLVGPSMGAFLLHGSEVSSAFPSWLSTQQ